MSTTSPEGEYFSADEANAIIKRIKDQQNQRYRSSTNLLGLGLFVSPVETVPEEDSFESDVQEMRKDWMAIGNDLRIAILRHRLKSALQVTSEQR